MLVGRCTNLETYLFEFSKIINHHQKSFTHYLHSKDFYIISFVWLLKPHDSTHAYLIIIIIQIAKEKLSQVNCLIGNIFNHFWSSLFVEKNDIADFAAYVVILFYKGTWMKENGWGFYKFNNYLEILFLYQDYYLL